MLREDNAMTLKHRLNVYRNLSLIFFTTVRRHGPIIAVKRTTNFIRSKRMNTFFVSQVSENIPARVARKARNSQVPPSILIVTHVWNTSGVPILAESLAGYLNSHKLNAGIWSIAKPIRGSSKILGHGNFYKMKSTFSKLPDSIFLNTTCVEASFIDNCCELLSGKKIKHLILYSHEDIVILPRKTIQLLDVQDSASCHIFAGSQKTAAKLQRYFKNKVIASVPYQIADSPRIKKIRRYREKIEFKSLEILLVGSTADSRKGHILAARSIKWARKFQKASKFINPSKLMREINITVIGAQLFPDLDSISSRTIEILNRRLSILPILDFQNYVESLLTQNVVICLSQYETLPLFVSEAMARGCLVVRNSCGGMKEQLLDRKNGIRLFSSSIINGYKIFALACESESTLHEMSERSSSRFDEVHSSSWDDAFRELFSLGVVHQGLDI